MFAAGLGNLTPEDEIQLQQKAQATFGKSLDQLSESELESLFGDYSGQKSLYTEMAMMDMPQGKTVNGLHLAPGWGEIIGAGAQKLAGAYKLGKVREDEAAARQTAARVQTRRDELDDQRRREEAARAERERREWLAMILGRG